MNLAATIASTCRQLTLLQSVRLLILLSCITLMQPFVATAQTSVPGALPPAAQEALNKGIIAAKVPDYLLAIRFFEEARKAAPEAPVVYLNMGLAESRIPGRELRAIAWFGAYLSAYPEAPNAAAVKEQIDVLTVRNQSNVSRLIKSLQETAGQIPDEFSRGLSLNQIVGLWAEAGDIAAAVKSAELMKYPDEARKSIAEAQLKAGDIAGAQSTLSEIQDAEKKVRMQIALMQAQITTGDTAGAKETLVSTQETANLVRGNRLKIQIQIAIAIIQARLGDSVGSQVNFAKAIESVTLWTDVFAKEDKPEYLTRIAEAQIEAGDITGGQKTLVAAQAAADLIEDADRNGSARRFIAKIYIKSGDIGQAEKMAKGLSWYDESRVLQAVINLQIKKGDIAGALKNAELIKMDNKSEIQTAIAEIQIQTGDIRGAADTLTSSRKTADLIETPNKSYALQLIAEAQAKTGDLAGSRATLASAQKAANLIPSKDFMYADPFFERKQAKSDVARAYLKLGVFNPRTIAWLDQLDDDGLGRRTGDCPLGSPPFLDLAGYLKSLPEDSKPDEVFRSLHETAEKIVKANNIIQQMVKQQIK